MQYKQEKMEIISKTARKKILYNLIHPFNGIIEIITKQANLKNYTKLYTYV